MPIAQELKIAESVVRVLVDDASRGATDPALWPSIGEYPCYDAFLYQSLMADEVRNKHFREALRKSAGKVVLDIGTGNNLLWARESLGYGASRVLAIEVMEESFQQASAMLESLRMKDSITLLKGSSTSLEIEPKADVCVAEVIGSVAGAEGAAVIFDDARRRHLVPNGIVIPHRAVTRAAAVCLTEVMGGRAVAFAAQSLKYLAHIFATAGTPFDVRLRISNPVPDAIVSSDEAVEILELNGDLRKEQETRTTLTIERPGRIDGVLAWLELWCARDQPPLNALRERTSWASVYFRLFHPEIAVQPGDTLGLTFRAKVSGNGINPDYELDATLRTRAAGEFTGHHSSPHHGQVFRHCALYRTLFPE